MEQGKIVDPQAFIGSYDPTTPVAFGNGMRMTLAQALAAEQLLCPANPDARQDPRKRLGYLANMLAAGGSLRPEPFRRVPLHSPLR